MSVPNEIEAITTRTASSVADLMELEETLGLSPQPAGTWVGETPTRWSFRGQSRCFGTLLPSFAREFRDVKSAKTVAFVESQLIEAFREQYHGVWMGVPNMPSPDKIQSGRELRCLSVMQHYGVPTRLLDWTTNLWTAVYFACAGDPDEDAELWFYDREAFRPASATAAQAQQISLQFDAHSPDPAVLDGRCAGLLIELDMRLTPRMGNQYAHHTVASEVFADHATLLRRILPTADETAEPAFVRMLISKRCKQNALEYLNKHQRVSASTIFPDFEGLGRFLRWQLDSLKTMLL